MHKLQQHLGPMPSPPQSQQQQPPPSQQQQQNGGGVIGGETRWHYLGPDGESYGPYSAKDMMFWLQSGYFNESFQVRTENEQAYHSLGEWSQLLGTNPFTVPVHSLEVTIAQMNSMRQQHAPPPPPPQMMMMPPGLQPPFPPPMQMRFPPFMPLPLLHQMGPNGPIGGPGAPAMHSQPPSEPIDAGSLSHTPDSEGDTAAAAVAEATSQQAAAWMVALGLAGPRKSLGHHHHHHQMQMGGPPMPLMSQMGGPMQMMAPPPPQPLVPQMHHMLIGTEPIATNDVECQTDAPKLELSKAKAARLLSELFGQTVVIG